MATNAESAMIEIEAAVAQMALEHEGLRDLGKLVTNDDARIAVAKKLEEYDKRLVFLRQAHTSLTNLVLHGHPRLDATEVVAAAYDDIKNQIDTTTAALGKFTSGAAQTLNVTTGEPVRK